jgi:hypothetical protein
MNDDILNAAVASIEETREADCRNADNHDLGHWQHFPIGDVPEVNGLWAQELKDFVPTTGELLVIAKHWAGVAIEHLCRMGQRELFGQYQGLAANLFCMATGL